MCVEDRVMTLSSTFTALWNNLFWFYALKTDSTVGSDFVLSGILRYIDQFPSVIFSENFVHFFLVPHIYPFTTCLEFVAT